MPKLIKGLTLPFLALVLSAMVGVLVVTAPPAAAQGGVPPVTNIQLAPGPNSGEVVVSWDAVPQATHYRIGYVNMEVDYHFAKASCTAEWIEAFIYVDVNARNIPVNSGRAEYTVRRLSPGARHAFTVLTTNNFYNTRENAGGDYSWPQNPRWKFLPGRDTLPPGISVPAIDCTPRTLSTAEIAQLVRPALVKIVVTDGAGRVSSGTGFIVRSEGLVVTNRHVVDDASSVAVLMTAPDGRQLNLTGQVVGRGILADLAVVRLPSGRGYPTLPLGNSNAVAQGDEITAWGYPLGSFLGTDLTVTRGIVSSTNRIFDDTRYIQTDAAIAPGNSGGPVVDRFGNVVGVNTAGLVRILDDGTTVPIPGIYLAIASNEVRARLRDMATGGPASATYRNLRFGYGYSMTIPKGWYVSDELPTFTQFWPYGRKGVSYIGRYTFTEPSGASDSDLDLLVNFRWDRELPTSAENWILFEKIAKQKITMNGHDFYRLEYRRQGRSTACVSHRIELVSVSSAYPGKPIGFVAGVGVCVLHLNTHIGDRQTMLNSFRP